MVWVAPTAQTIQDSFCPTSWARYPQPPTRPLPHIGRRPTLVRVPGYVRWSPDDAEASSRLPADDASDLDWMLFYQEGVLSRRQAIAAMSWSKLRHLVTSGRWQRVRRGIYAAHNGALTRNQQLWTAVLSCGDDAVLAGLTAACAEGLRRDPGTRIHILVVAGQRPNQPGRAVLAVTPMMPAVVVHRTATLPDKDLQVGLPRRTTMARSLVDAAQWAGTDDEARAIVAAACRQRVVLPEEVLDVLRRLPRARRRSIVLETIGYTTSGAEAISEMNFDALCRTHGLPAPDRQVPRRDERGRLRYLDAYWRRYGVHAEVDGGVHSDPEVWWRDQFRQNDLWIGGEIVVRFPAWAIRNRPAEVADQLRRALVEGGWRPADLG
jgi:hypothetical protein